MCESYIKPTNWKYFINETSNFLNTFQEKILKKVILIARNSHVKVAMDMICGLYVEITMTTHE